MPNSISKQYNNMKFDFLLSSERSGSNLITKMLDAHPSVCGPAPSHMIRTFSQNILNYGDLKKDENWNALLNDVADIMRFQLGEWGMDFSAEELKCAIKERKLSHIVRYIHEKEADSLGKRRLFIKENKVYNFIEYLLIAFPDAKFLWLTRDPRDMALSYKKSSNHPGGIMRAAEIWANEQAELKKIYGYLQEEKKVLLLRYEDLLSNPEMHLKKVCDFFEIDYSDAMLGFHKEELTVKNAEKLRNWENLDKPVLTTNFNKYKTELSEKEITYIEKICGELMSFLKYDREYLDVDTENFAEEVVEQTLELNEQEQKVREDRLNVIKRILNRRLT